MEKRRGINEFHYCILVDNSRLIPFPLLLSCIDDYGGVFWWKMWTIRGIDGISSPANILLSNYIHMGVDIALFRIQQACNNVI